MGIRDDLRSGLLSGTPAFRTTTIKRGELVYEVRQPSVTKRSAIFIAAGASTTMKGNRKGKEGQVKLDHTTVDIARLQIQAVLECVYVPGTEDNVFGQADVEAIAKLPTGGLFEELSDAAMDLMEVDTTEKKAS